MLKKYLTGYLPQYIMGLFLKKFMIITGVLSSLIYLITLIEIFRKTNNHIEVTLTEKLLITAKQIPFILEQILPLLILLSGIWLVFTLVKHSEIVVAKGAGVSVWRLGMMLSLVSGIIGLVFVFGIGIFSSKWMKEYYDWNYEIKQETIPFQEKLALNGEKVMVLADGFSSSKREFSNFKFYIIGEKEVMKKVITAPRAIYKTDDNHLEIYNPSVTSIYDNKLELEKSQKKLVLQFKELRPFLRLQSKATRIYDIYTYPKIIERSYEHELNVNELWVGFYNLLSLPFFCMVMAGVCATFAPDSMRMGGGYRMILFGLLTGFALYGLDMILATLAKGGLFPILLGVLFAKIIACLGTAWMVLNRDYHGIG